MLPILTPPEFTTVQDIFAAVGTIVGDVLLQPEIVKAAGAGGETTCKLIDFDALTPVLAATISVPVYVFAAPPVVTVT